VPWPRGIESFPYTWRGKEANMGLNVLIADDNRDAADTLAKLVSFWGHDPRIAYDGVEALDEARMGTFDVGLFDVGMPRLDGYELARRLRQEQLLADPILIAVTAYSGKEFEQFSAKAGFDLHLVKPVAPQLLQEALGLIEEASAQRAVLKQAAQENQRLRWELRRLLVELYDVQAVMRGWQVSLGPSSRPAFRIS
jgi:CheY-like chemotaxis protein